MYELMMNDPDEVDRMNWNEARVGRETARAEEIPRSSTLQPGQPITGTVATSSKAMDYRGAGRPDAATLHAEAPHTAAPEAAALSHELLEVPEDESETDEIQIGRVEEYEEFITGDQEDVPMEDAEDDAPEVAESKASSEDVRAADLHVQDSDDDEVDVAEPPAKRARELQMCVGPGSVREADAQLLTSQKHVQELRSLMATAEVKRILKELDECPELQLPRQQKRNAEAAEWNADCAEI